MEQARPELARLGVGVGVALVGQHVDPQAEHLAVVVQGQLAVHVEVAGEPGRDQVAGAVLDPLDRPADQQRGRGGDHVARVDGHLVAEAAAEVGRDDLDLVLGQPGDQREHRPVGVRGLGGHVDGDLAGDRVDVGHAAAGLHRGRVAAGVEGVEADHPVGLLEGPVGGLLVAGLPVVDAVVLLVFLVVPDDRGAGLEALLRGDDHRQRVVVDLDQLEGVVGDVGVLGDHAGDLLALHAHLVGGQHGLGVAGQGRHPGQVVLGQQLAGDDRHHPGEGLGGRGVDRVDPGVGDRAAQDRHVQHARQVDVVDVVAPALEEAVVLLALDAPAQPALGRVLFGHLGLPSWRRWWRCRTGASWPSTAPR